MKNDARHLGKDMPRWARAISVFAGVALLVAGLVALLAIRPVRLDVLILAITALGLSADFLQGAFYGRWPVLIHCWL